MNIALFSDSYIPTKSGIVTVVVQLKKVLMDMGHNVFVVTVDTKKDNEKDDYVLKLKSVPLGLGTDQFISFPEKKKVLKFIRDNNIDIIHCHTEFFIAHMAKFVGKKFNIPTIVTTHTMWEDFYKHYLPGAKYFIPVSMIRKLTKRLYKKFYAMINVSSKARNYFKESFMLPNIPSAIIPNAIDTSLFLHKEVKDEDLKKIKQNLGINLDDKVILFVGRIGEEKRVLELLDECIKIVNKNENVKSVFVGDGPAFHQMTQVVKQKKLTEKILFTGFVKWTEVYLYYRIADVFVTASMSEMHSMTILEAMLSKLPIVARDDLSFHDTIFNEKNGYLCKTDNEISEKVCELILDENKLKKFGDNSLKIANNFSMETYAKKTVHFYEYIIEHYPNSIDENDLREKIEKLN